MLFLKYRQGLPCSASAGGREIGILNIAICDDEAIHRREIQTMLSRYLQEHPSLEGKLWVYSEGKALLEQAREMGGFDLYILDILMPEFSGIEIGRRLRALGDGGEILYLTNSNDFAADSYDVGAFFYLLKPVEEEKLFRVLAGAVEKLLWKKNRSMLVRRSGMPSGLAGGSGFSAPTPSWTPPPSGCRSGRRWPRCWRTAASVCAAQVLWLIFNM